MAQAIALDTPLLEPTMSRGLADTMGQLPVPGERCAMRGLMD